MKDWKQVIEKFLNQYREKDYYEGAILFGSYASGNNNEQSDIDIRICTSDTQNWRERGNTKIDGFLVEYFITPLFKEYQYLEQEYNAGISICYASMMGNGIILDDKNGEINKLQAIAKEYILKPFKEADEYKIRTDLYHLWDQYDELKSMYNHNLNINMMYYPLLNSLIEVYYYYNRYAIIPFSKLEQIYKDETFRNNYSPKNMPNNDFINLVIKCLDEKNDDNKIKQIGILYDYIINSCGGFNIEQFKIGNEISR